MPSLDEIRTALLPDGVVASAGDAVRGGVQVGWVRVLRARVPALDVLEPGDVVIVPASALAVVAGGPAEVRELVASLASGGAAGLLLVAAAAGAGGAGGRTGADVDAGLGEVAAAARSLGLPAVRVDGVDAGALERRLIGYLVDRRGELERQASDLERRLARIAMGGGGLEALAAEIAAFLDCGVALEGRRGGTLAVHAPGPVAGALAGGVAGPGDAATAAGVTGYLARPQGTGRRVPLPGPPGERTPAGWLVLLGDRPASDLETVAAERIAPLLALELEMEAQVRRARDEAGRSERLPADGPPWVVLVARQAGTGPDAEDLRRTLRLGFPARRLSLRGTSESLELRGVAAPESDDPRGLAIAARVASLLGRPVAVSRPFTDAAARPAEEAAARSALQAVERLPHPPTVVRADREPAYRLLASLAALPDGPAAAKALLAPLLGGRPGHVATQLATLRAVLEHGTGGEAASALGIHRNTLAYRVRQLEAATGWDLQDPDLRLALAIALRFVQSA